MRARETVRRHGTTTPGSVDPLCPFLRILAPFPGPVPSPTIPAPSLTPRLHLVLCSLIAHSSHSFAAPAPSPTPFSREERGRGGMQALDTQLPLLSLSLPLSSSRALCLSLVPVPLYTPSLLSSFPSTFRLFSSLRRLICTTYYIHRARPCRPVSPCSSHPLARITRPRRFHPRARERTSERASVSLSTFVFR